MGIDTEYLFKCTGEKNPVLPHLSRCPENWLLDFGIIGLFSARTLAQRGFRWAAGCVFQRVRVPIARIVPTDAF